MDFEEMKVIWDSQNQAPIYGVNEAELHTILRTKSRKFGRLVFWQVFASYGSTVATVTSILLVLLANSFGVLSEVATLSALTGWDIVALLVAACAWIHFSVAIYLGQKRQKYRESRFTSSLRGDLDRDIAQTEFQIRKREKVLLGFIPPYVGSTLMALVMFRISGLSEWLVVPLSILMIVCLLNETRSQKRLVERKMLPRKLELENLREKLIDSHQ